VHVIEAWVQTVLFKIASPVMILLCLIRFFSLCFLASFQHRQEKIEHAHDMSGHLGRASRMVHEVN
jgi:hypothetical protein